MMPADFDYEDLLERVEMLMAWAQEPRPERQRLWRVRTEARDHRKWIVEVIDESRRTVGELRQIATQLEQAATVYQSWLPSPPHEHERDNGDDIPPQAA